MNRPAPRLLPRTVRFGALFAALAGGALASQAAEFGTVVSSTPVTVPMTVSQRVCDTERQVVPAQQTGAGAVVGMIAGGLLGNTVGGGSGRALATGVGAVTGAIVGNQIEANTAAANGTEVPVQRCRIVNTTQQRTVGYDVMYEYHGQRYSTRMSYDPGARVEIDPKPRDAGTPVPLAQAAPDASYSTSPPVYTEPAPVYAPAPVYVTPYPVYAPVYAYPYPAVSIGFGYYGGGYHRRWR
ncbi:MAG TPA: glycine zipper 2TM domain-containing protein [Burkholderiaceae bacterium]|nr:glycine zipper 2TM domain-containing protein [Burkholderiaceae bacterium]